MSNSLQIGSSNLKPIQSVSSPAESTRENQTTQPIVYTTVGENQTQPLSPQPLPLPKPPSNTITGISFLLQTITLSDNTLGESKIPLRAAIINGTATNPDLSKTTRGQLYEWYPIVSFHFDELGNIGLVNVKHVLMGPIKSYQSSANILEEAIYFQNVRPNEQVSLEVSQPGLNY